MSWHWDVKAVQESSMATDNVVTLLTEKLERLPPLLQTLLPRVACLGAPFGPSSLSILADHFCDSKELEQMLLKYWEKAVERKKAHNQRSHDSILEGDGDELDESDRSAKPPSPNTRNPLQEALKTMVPEYTIAMVLEEERLLTTSRSGDFKWEHDKVQEAALGLASKEEMSNIKFEVGALLFDKLSLQELTKETFVITNLMNAKAESLPVTNERRLEIARLNLVCGKAAMASSAFSLATEYFAKGISLLPKDAWEKELYSVTLELHANAAEAFFCIGDHAKTEEICNTVFAVPNATLLEKRRLYNVRVHSLGAQGMTADARDLTLEVLAELGCKFPKRNQSIFTLAGVMRNMSSLDKNIKMISQANVIESEEIQWAIYCKFEAEYEGVMTAYLLPLVFMKGLRWTIKYGTTDMTSAILGTVGLLFGASLGDFAAGRKYCELAKKYMNRKTESRTLFLSYAFVMHLQIPFEQCKRPLLDAYEAGLRSGDLESAFWASMNFLELQMHTGVALEKVIMDLELYTAQFESHKHEKQLAMSRMTQQFATNMSEPVVNADSHKVKGAIFDEDTYIPEIAGQMQYFLEWQHLMRVKTFSAFWFNEHELVVKIMEENDYHNFIPEKFGPGVTGNGPVYFNSALSCVSVARSTQDKAKKKKYKAIAKKFLEKKFKVWSNKGNPNVLAYEDLLAAELASLEGKDSIAKKHYETAILLAGKWTLTNYRALSHERAGDHALRLGDDEECHYHYKNAIQLFDEWGAKWRAHDLREKIENLKPGS
ncbi:MAG: hypothetical protein SGARI_001293, partial [Bacillariaceae sp.]